MLKSDLIARLALRHPERPRRDIEAVVSTVLEEMCQALACGGRIELRGFGILTVRIRPPRTGRNPRTGAQLSLSEKKMLRFRMAKDLLRRLNSDHSNSVGTADTQAID